MRVKRANIDSLNLSDANMTSLFIANEDYIIETVKSRSVFKPKLWSEAFGQSLSRNIIGADIIHTNLGLELALKTYSRTQNKQVLELAGLHSYNQRSKLLMKHLQGLWSHIQDTKLTRIDIALDWVEIPSKVLKKLKGNREPFKWVNSIYFKTPKEGKRNYYINIIAYDKAKKENLTTPMHRLEFSFSGTFLKDMYLKDLSKVYEKIEKTIKRIIGITIKINPIISHA